jgi:FixJ family two-component response regulator
MLGRKAIVTDPVVYVVDDDPQACRAVADLARASGRQVRAFESPEEFLQSVDPDRPGCVVLVLQLAGRDGQQVRQELKRRGIPISVVLLTSHADSLPTVRVLRHDDVVVVDKPYHDDQFWLSVEDALASSEAEYRRRRYQLELERRFKALSPQDREVLHLIMQGQKNRSIAKRLEVSLRTVENRRRRCFDVMEAGSLAELTRRVVEFEHDLTPNGDRSDRWLSLPHARQEA